VDEDMAVPDQQYEVLDEEGHKTGQFLAREEVHKRQLWHEVANVWILNTKGEVLLQRRGPKVELAPNVWDVAVGTHVHPGEDPALAGARALQAELGVTELPENLKHLFNIQAANPMPDGSFHKVLGHVFLMKSDIALDSLKVNPDEIAELAWRPLSQIIADFGSDETRATYFPRAGNYYQQLFEIFMAEVPPELAL
jgi:isopentenyldiphosphate isomerase